MVDFANDTTKERLFAEHNSRTSGTHSRPSNQAPHLLQCVHKPPPHDSHTAASRFTRGDFHSRPSTFGASAITFYSSSGIALTRSKVFYCTIKKQCSRNPSTRPRSNFLQAPGPLGPMTMLVLRVLRRESAIPLEASRATCSINERGALTQHMAQILICHLAWKVRSVELLVFFITEKQQYLVVNKLTCHIAPGGALRHWHWH